MVVLALLALPAAAHGATTLDTVPRATPVSAYGGVTAWSRFAPDGFRLVVSTGTAEPRVLPIAPRSVPFDVDLGPGPDGRVVAAYSRCRREPAMDVTPPLPAYTSGRGCDVYRFALDGTQEQRLRGASTDQASEMLPSIWRDEVAFVRVYEQRAGRRDGLALDRLPYVYVRRLDGRGGSRRQPGDARGRTGVPGPVALDLYGRRLGFVWQYDGSGETPTYRARVVTSDTDTRVAAEVRGGGLSRPWLTGAGFAAGRFVLGLECLGDPGGCADLGLRHLVLRYGLSSRMLDAATLPVGNLVDLSVDGLRVALTSERFSEPRSSGPECTTIGGGDAASVCDVSTLSTAQLRFGPAPARLRR